MVSFSTKHIDYIERNFLDEFSREIETDKFNFRVPEPGSIRFVKILGISRLWEHRKEEVASARYVMADVLAGLYGEKIPFIYLLICRGTSFDLYIGTYEEESIGGRSGLTVDDAINTVQITMRSAYPGIDLENGKLSVVKESIEPFDFVGLVTGTPTTKVGTEKMGVEQIERLMRGLYGRNWGYMVLASPLEERSVASLHNVTLNEMRVVVDAQTSAGTRNPIAERYM